MNIQKFGEQHNGIEKIVRRHFDYDVPVTGPATPGLIYSRNLDPSKLGLSAKGVMDSIDQGRKLARMEIIPTAIICGIDQRNRDGARFTAAGIEEVTGDEVPFFTSPAVTYPHYRDPEMTSNCHHEFGDSVVHMNLAEHGAVTDLWTEPVAAFERRIRSIVELVWGKSPILFDLNFEQMVLLYYLFLKKIDRLEIPFKKGSWLPTKGGGLVFAKDGAVAEFTPELEIVNA